MPPKASSAVRTRDSGSPLRTTTMSGRPGAVGVGTSALVAYIGTVFVEAGTMSVRGICVEVAIGTPDVGAGLADAGEQALKNRLNVTEPTHASISRKKSRREILFNFHLHHDYSETKRTLHE